MIREINASARENPSIISQVFHPRQRSTLPLLALAQNRDLRNGSLDSDVDRNAEGKSDGEEGKILMLSLAVLHIHGMKIRR